MIISMRSLFWYAVFLHCALWSNISWFFQVQLSNLPELLIRYMKNLNTFTWTVVKQQFFLSSVWLNQSLIGGLLTTGQHSDPCVSSAADICWVDRNAAAAFRATAGEAFFPLPAIRAGVFTIMILSCVHTHTYLLWSVPPPAPKKAFIFILCFSCPLLPLRIRYQAFVVWKYTRVLPLTLNDNIVARWPLKSSQTGFLNVTMSSLHSHDLKPVEQLQDVEQQEMWSSYNASMDQHLQQCGQSVHIQSLPSFWCHPMH